MVQKVWSTAQKAEGCQKQEKDKKRKLRDGRRCWQAQNNVQSQNNRQIIKIEKPTKTHQTKKRRTEKLEKTVTCLRNGAKPSANSACSSKHASRSLVKVQQIEAALPKAIFTIIFMHIL